MKRFALALSLSLSFCATAAMAQQPGTDPPLPELGEASPSTPEVWLYEQMVKRYDDPQFMVRKKAEFRATQRMTRIASRQWYGYSNLRPRSDPKPMSGWTATSWDRRTRIPYQWSGYGYPTVILAPSPVRAYGLW